MPRATPPPRPPADPAGARPLSDAELAELARYYGESLRAEEALRARPRAQKPLPRSAGIRLDHPVPGQDYAKLPLDAGLAAHLVERLPVAAPLDDERAGFFEHWLSARYRRASDDDGEAALVGFPTLLLARGELASLVRFPALLAFRQRDGKPFDVPSPALRVRGPLPEPPSALVLSAPPDSTAGLPCFIDTRLLSRELGVTGERIDALFAALRGGERGPRDVLVALLALLDGEGAQLGPLGLLEALGRAVAARCARAGRGTRSFAVGLLLDGASAKTTWALQQELKAVVRSEGRALSSPARSYLSGAPLPAGWAPQHALFRGPPLTALQRDVASRFWGSRLSAVQGPPGTGKTTLVLHLAAEALVRRIGALVDEGRLPDAPLVITSSNNRAVDNVLDPLWEVARGGYPLALRAGNRQVMAEVLLPALRHVEGLLARAVTRPAAERQAALKDALYAFCALRHRVHDALAPHVARHTLGARRAALMEALAALPQAPEEPATTRAPRLLRGLATAARELGSRLEAATALCTAAGTDRELGRALAQLRVRALPAFEAERHAADLGAPLLDPAELAEGRARAELEAVLEAALDRLSALTGELERALDGQRHAQERKELAAELDVVTRSVSASATPSVLEGSFEDEARGLFEAAVVAHGAYADAHAEQLLPVLRSAILRVTEERSLRSLFRDAPGDARALQALVPVWGSTLLSMGNVWPSEPGRIGALVIDEAGQCHPAHALSGLLRTERALVLGDVHQLSPVFELGPDDDARLVASLKLKLAPERLAPYRVHSASSCSAQALADRAVDVRPVLRDHFRCQPAIIGLSDALCDYGLTVHTPARSARALAPFLHAPLLFCDVAGPQSEHGGSQHNPAEARVVLGLLDRLLAAGIAPDELALITPYRGQLHELSRAVLSRGLPLERSAELHDEALSMEPRPGVAIGTVHRFQGGERRIVLFSAVVSERASLAFLDRTPNLLNVAVSRAREHFVAVGHRTALLAGHRTRLLVERAAPLLPP